MRKRFIATFVCSALSLIGASGFALAETIGRYECSFIGTPSQEPIDDRTGHSLSSNQYSCFGVDGLLKGAVYTGSSIGEWEGPQGTFFLAAESIERPGDLRLRNSRKAPGP